MGLSTYYVSRRRGGEGVGQMLTIADQGVADYPAMSFVFVC